MPHRGSGGGIPQRDSAPGQRRSVSRSPPSRWGKNIFELNVARHHGYFLSAILQTPHFLRGLAPKALFSNHFVRHHVVPGHNLGSLFLIPFPPGSSSTSECSAFHFRK